MKASELATEYVATMAILTTNGIHQSDAQVIAYMILELAHDTHDSSAHACGFAVAGDDED